MLIKNKKYLKKIKNLISCKIDVSNFNVYFFKEGWAVIRDLRTNKQGWISKDLKRIINPIFDDCYNFSEGFGVFEKDEKYGLIDTSGKILVDELDWCYDFCEGFGVFKKDGKKYLINTSGEVISEGFDSYFNFSEGVVVFREVALFGEEETFGWIDSSGEILGKGFDMCFSFKEGYGRFRKNGKYGWIDKTGKIYTKKPY